MRALALALVLSACAAPARPALQPTAAGLRALHYRVSADPKLSELAVRLCFEGQPPPELVYGTRSGAPFLRDARALGAAGGPGFALPVVDGKVQLVGLAADSCMRYRIDLQGAIDHDALLLAYPGDGSRMIGSELLLWRPVRRPPGLTSTLEFSLPAGMQVSTPWPLHAGRYQLDERAFAFTGHIVLGAFQARQVPVPGGELQLISIEGFDAQQRDAIAAWLATAAKAVSALAGAFPVPEAQVIAVPTSPSRYPIHFGHTGRSGGASIVLFLPTDVSRESLQADWIAVHEFSHLLHPFVQRSDAWLSEGLATYLQEVLRVRAGLLAPARAWQRLYEGALLGRDAPDGLAQETERMPHAHNYQRVYWAGAAIMLMADVELRRETSGRSSLDKVLAALARQRVRDERAVSAAELLARMDALAGVPVFTRTAQRYLSGTRFPDLGDDYRALGLMDSAGAPCMRADAPLAWVRDAIMSARSSG